MNTPVLLKDFAGELVRRGLPVDYAQDTAAELADHHRDLIEELQASGLGELEAEIAAGERLGERRVLVKKAVREFQRRYWCARWPLLTFLIGPIPLVIFSWVATSLACLAIVWSVQKMGITIQPHPDGILSWGEWVFFRGVQLWYMFAMPVLVILLLTRWATRAAISPLWVGVSSGLLAVFLGLFKFEFKRNVFQIDLPGDQILLNARPFESWMGTWQWYTHDPLHICQFLLPLGIAAIMMLRIRQVALRAERLAIAADHFHGGKHEHARVA